MIRTGKDIQKILDYQKRKSNKELHSFMWMFKVEK